MARIEAVSANISVDDSDRVLRASAFDLVGTGGLPAINLRTVSVIVGTDREAADVLQDSGRRAKSFWLVMGRFQAVGAGRGW